MRAILTLLLLGLALKAMPQIVTAEYFYDDAAVAYGQGTPLTVGPNAGEVTIAATLPISDLSPGFHQVFFRIKDAIKGWSPIIQKVFLIPWPLDTIVGFRYCIDPQEAGSTWVYKTFPSPSADVEYTMEVDMGGISKGIHFIEAVAKSKSGIWTPVSKGTFFSLYSEPLNITSLEYYFETEDFSMSPLYTVSNFDPSPDVTLDSVTFTIPVTSLINLKRYLMYIRAVDETGNKGLFVCDTLVYHGPTGLEDRIYVASEVMVFPNPVSDMLNLKFVPLNNTSSYIIRLYDLSGRVVMEEELFFSRDEYALLETSGLMPGVYRIVISTPTGNQVTNSEFVKR